jgi:23S rRNA (adenine2030-N6)-methyltransferase
MNYRHAFHAGNHTEVFKHSALVMLLEHLAQKPQAFMVLDTHAGTGVYDLESEAARRPSGGMPALPRTRAVPQSGGSQILSGFARNRAHDAARRRPADCL